MNNFGIAADVQNLELRTLPAGTVTAIISGTGTKERLTITGDNANNEIVLAVRPTGLFLKADDSDTVIKFGKQTSAPGGELKLKDSTTLPQNLSINMKNGDDNVEIAVGDHFDEISESTGKLPDFITATAVSATIGSTVSVTMGNGDDVFDFAVGPAASLVIGGAVSVDLGSGDDMYAAGATEAIFQTLFSTSIGQEIGGEKRLTMQGAVSVQGGSGYDLLLMASAVCGGAVTLNSGSQDNIIDVANLQVTGKLTINGSSGSDIVVLRQTVVGGATLINTGAGDDVLAIKAVSLSKGSSINLGAGDDVLSLGESDITGSITIDGSSGHDNLAVFSAITTNTFAKKLRFEETTLSADSLGDVIVSQISSMLNG